jgi:hypothetical protein
MDYPYNPPKLKFKSYSGEIMSAIEFNGKTYNSYEEMPRTEQVQYDRIHGALGDANGNGVENFMEDEFFQCMMQGDANGVVFRGTTYKSFAEMPEDIRPKLKYAFNQLTNMGMIHPHVHGLLSK